MLLRLPITFIDFPANAYLSSRNCVTTCFTQSSSSLPPSRCLHRVQQQLRGRESVSLVHTCPCLSILYIAESLHTLETQKVQYFLYTTASTHTRATLPKHIDRFTLVSLGWKRRSTKKKNCFSRGNEGAQRRKTAWQPDHGSSSFERCSTRISS